MANDKFGVQKIFDTKSGGQEWFLADNPNSDSRFLTDQLDEEVKGNKNDGFFVDDNQALRLYATTTAGYNAGQVTEDHGEASSREYMMQPTDWKNVEITGYVKHEQIGNNVNEYAWKCRGGKHLSPQPYCRGCALMFELQFPTGKVRFRKEQWHSEYESREWTDKLKIGDIKGKWIGMKFVVFNFDNGGKPGVTMRLYVDKANNNKWELAHETKDTGGWGTFGKECDGNRDQVIHWGGPLVIFRWDDTGKTRWKNFSVREIDPNPPKPSPPPTEPDEPAPVPPPPAAGLVSNAITSHYRIAVFIIPTCAAEQQDDPNPPPGTPGGGQTRQTRLQAIFYDLKET